MFDQFGMNARYPFVRIRLKRDVKSFCSPSEGDLADFAACELADFDGALEALGALDVIEVGALIERHPAGEGLCYAGACTEADFAQAHALACRRGAALEKLVPETFGL